MRLVLDTNALFHEGLGQAVREAKAVGAMSRGELRVILPAVALAERMRQLRRDGRDLDAWRRELDAAGIEVEPFGEAEATRLAARASEDASWARHARDHLILAHVDETREVVTADSGGPWPRERRLAPHEAAASIRELLSLP